MAQTVYLLGAGINRGITKEIPRHKVSESPVGVGEPYTLKPPLATDFFRQWSWHPYVLKYPEQHREEFKQLYDYVERYWKLDFAVLQERPFDLEACYTLIQQQKRDAWPNAEEYLRLNVIDEQLTTLLQGLLDWFTAAPVFDLDLMSFADLVLGDHATILTFNYDT